MALRDIILLPDNILKQQSVDINKVDADMRDLAADMFETMYDAPGIGMAAVQIGLLKRMIVIDTAREEEQPDPICLINPKIVWSSEETAEYEEGCLSIPEVYDLVIRPTQVKVQYIDQQGAECERHCEGLLSTCVQHEIDHLNGVLFIDHLTRLKRERVIRKFVKSAKQNEPSQSGNNK